MEPATNSEKKRLWMGLSWRRIVALLILLYPLSAGPFVWLSGRGWLPDFVTESLSLLYLPIGWATWQSDTIHSVLAPYIWFWEDLP